MQTIITLPPHIVSQIAAGEVIERPSFAVKEIIENALDAKATDIQIHIEDAGFTKITVTDNGLGMSVADLRQSYKPHTTSKLADFNLSSISSLGFRGEALASIASVAKLTIKSRPQTEQFGHMVHLENGEVIHDQPAGMQKGTIVTITHLFSLVPARNKQAWDKRKEFRKIHDVVLQCAVMHPEVSFQLTHNKRIVFHFQKSTSQEERLIALLGADTVSELVPIEYSKNHVTLTGFVAKPHITTIHNHKQYLFVNKRPVRDNMLAHAVKTAHGSLLPTAHSPVFILFLALPSELVDSNVHPQKLQVRFMNEKSVYNHVLLALEKALAAYPLAVSSLTSNKHLNMPDFATRLLKEKVLQPLKKEMKNIPATQLTQVDDMYILVIAPEEIIFIDQHAADERVFYEQYVAAFMGEKKNVISVGVKQPRIISLSSHEFLLLEEQHKILKKLGFVWEDYGNQTIKITRIPEFFKDHDLSTLFREVLVANGDNKKDIDSQSKTMLTFLACRSAVKAGDKLSKKDCKKLIKKLNNTPHNYTCPHGRPTRFILTTSALNKIFKRE